MSRCNKELQDTIVIYLSIHYFLYPKHLRKQHHKEKKGECFQLKQKVLRVLER